MGNPRFEFIDGAGGDDPGKLFELARIGMAAAEIHREKGDTSKHGRSMARSVMVRVAPRYASGMLARAGLVSW